MDPVSGTLFLVTVGAPYALRAGVAAGQWMRRRFAPSSATEILTAVPEAWKRWAGARPEVRGAPLNTILALPGLRKVSAPVRAALLETATALGVPVDALATVIELESGWNPSAKNPFGAFGLIQLTKGAALPGFPDPSAVLGLGPVEQLAQVVIPYYQRQKGAAGSDPGRLYMLNFLPAFAQRPESFVLASATDPATRKIYESNKVFDRQKRGSFTVGDVFDSVAAIAKNAHGERITVDGQILGAPMVSFPSSGAQSKAGPPVRSIVTPPPRSAPALPRASASSPSTSGPATSTETEHEEAAPEGGMVFMGGASSAPPKASPSYAGAAPSSLAGGANGATAFANAAPSSLANAGPRAGGRSLGGAVPQDEDAAQPDAEAAELRAAGPGADCPCGCGGTCGCGPSGDDHHDEHEHEHEGNETIAALAALLGEASAAPVATHAGAGASADPFETLAAMMGGSSSISSASADPFEVFAAELVAAGCGCSGRKDFPADLVAAGCGCSGGPRLPPEYYGRTFRAAGPGGSARGLLLEAHRRGELEPIVMTEIPVPALGVIVTVALDALRAKIDGRSLRLPVTYAEQREIARDLGMLSPTKEIVDAVWAASTKIEPIGLFNVAEQRGLPLDALELVLTLNDDVDRAIVGAGLGPDALVRPLGKTWIVHPRIVEIGAVNYGWHTKAGKPIQSVGGRHDANHTDYSQLAHDLVSRSARRIDTGETVDLLDVYRAKFPEIASDLEQYA